MASKKSTVYEPAQKVFSMPHSDEAEKHLFCCILKNKSEALEIVSELSVEDFYSSQNKNVFLAIKQLVLDNQQLGFATLIDEMNRQGTTKVSGGVDYVSEIYSLLPSGAKYKDYLKIVKRCSLMRSLIESCNRIIEKACQVDSDEDALAFAEGEVYNLTQTRQVGKLIPMQDVLGKVMTEIQNRFHNPLGTQGVLTGFKRLDSITNGFKGGELIVLAARPSVGKSAMALNFVLNAAKEQQKSVAFFSLEMTNQQLLERLLSAMSSVPLSSIQTGRYSDTNELSKLNSAYQVLFEKMKLFGNDTANVRPSEIRSQCRRLKAQGNLDMIVIDYLGLMQSDQDDGRKENRQLEVSSITRSMKNLAKELNVPILLLCQLNRQGENRATAKDGIVQTSKPVLSDLRESGAIEQDADMVMFIHRPSEESKHEGKRQLIVAKNRHGATAEIPLGWIGKYVKFYDEEDFLAQVGATSTQQEQEEHDYMQWSEAPQDSFSEE